jgi:hypothetical protein
MPTWGEIGVELGKTLTPDGQTDFDSVRRKYLRQLAARTGRSTILYATEFTGNAPGGAGGSPGPITINLGDKQGLMEVMKGLPGPNLDLILHTPGGSPEALEGIVQYLRTRFDHMRAFVPLAAMSAGTMWALACDEIVMGKHSQLGPIDPQLPLAFGEQIRLAPAQAVKDQFELAKRECQDPANLAAWITVLRSYGPSLLQECQQAQDMSVDLVARWLEAYMFKGEDGGAGKAKETAEKFADYKSHRSHGRAIDREKAREYGATVIDLEDDQDLQDAVLSVHHAVMHTLAATAAVKLIENNAGRAFVVLAGVQIVGTQGQPAQPGSPKPKAPPPPPRKRGGKRH